MSETKWNKLKDNFYDVKCREFLSIVDQEVHSVLGIYWEDLKQQNSGFVAVHSLLVLWQAMKDPLYKELSKSDQNIIKWATLLHDLRKLSKPMIEGKDHVHPFKSGNSVLEVFKSLNFFPFTPGSDKEMTFIQASRLISESVQPLNQDAEKGVPLCTQVHSHHNLVEIFYYLWDEGLCPRDSFFDLVFRCVLFHQSLDGLKKYEPEVSLTSKEQARFCDPHFFDLIKIVMIADSGSYCIFSSEAQ